MNPVPRTHILSLMFQNVYHARTNKGTMSRLKNVFRSANHIKSTTSKKASATLSRNSTAANATNDTTLPSKNAKTYAKMASVGYHPKTSAVHLHFPTSKTTANITKESTQKLSNAKTIVTALSPGMIGKIMSASKLDVQSSASVERSLIT